MNPLSIKLMTLSVGLARGTGAMAPPPSAAELKTGKDRFATDYRAAESRCAALSGNANDICKAEARSARADAARQKRAADHAVTRERCDVHADVAKDTCRERARARLGMP